MAFELFIAAKPFSGATTVSLLYNIAHQPPAFPDGFSPSLRTVFEKALAKQAKERHSDLRAFLAAMIHGAIDDRVERERLLHEIGHVAVPAEDAPDDRQGPGAAPAISEGLGTRGLAVMGMAAAGLALVVGGGFYALSGTPSPDVPPSPVVVAKATPAAATPLPAPSAAPTRGATPSLPPRESSVPEAVATQPAVLAAAPTAPPKVPIAEISPVALVSLERPSLEPTMAPRAVPTPSASELREAVSDALREKGMRHVQVRLTEENHLVLANLRSPAEAERARQLAARVTDGELNIETALREEPRAAPRKVTKAPVADEPARDEPRPPVWEIRPEGAERTD
jgi:hypothetical protein